jgi:hypothetical protein
MIWNCLCECYIQQSRSEIVYVNVTHKNFSCDMKLFMWMLHITSLIDIFNNMRLFLLMLHIKTLIDVFKWYEIVYVNVTYNNFDLILLKRRKIIYVNILVEIKKICVWGWWWRYVFVCLCSLMCRELRTE